MTDAEITAGVRKGDAGAMRELFGATRDRVERTCLLFLEGDASLEPAAAGAYARAFELLAGGVAPGLPLADWLSALAARECLGALAALRRDFDAQTRSLEALAASIPTLVEITPEPAERVNFMVRGEMEELPPGPRAVLAAVELEGMDLSAFARRTGWPWAVALRCLMDARTVLAQRVKESFRL